MVLEMSKAEGIFKMFYHINVTPQEIYQTELNNKCYSLKRMFNVLNNGMTSIVKLERVLIFYKLYF